MRVTPRSEFPANAVSVASYVNRGEELFDSMPEISFFCFSYALDVLNEARQSSQLGKDAAFMSFLLKILDSAESCKARCTSPPTSSRFEEFVSEVFEGVDSEDRAGNSNRATIMKFLAASSFIDCLRQFGPLASYWEERRNYARFKATSIKKALDEGTVPIAGPPTSGGITFDLLEQKPELGDKNVFPSFDEENAKINNVDSKPVTNPKKDFASLLQNAEVKPNVPSANISSGSIPSGNIPSGYNIASSHSSTSISSNSTLSNHANVPPLPSNIFPTSSASVNLPVPPTSVKVDRVSLEKQIKQAMSAVNFGDYKGAKELLQKAINIIDNQ